MAREFNQQSEAGAKLDSAADFTFILCVGIAVIRSTAVPVWVLVCVGIIVLVRFAAYAVGYFRYRTFSSLHTLLNKAAGALLFAFPVLYFVLGKSAACVIVCGVAFVSAVEELVITISSKELDRDRKSLWARDKHD